MAFVIGAACIDELDGTCVDVCPVDCIYLGERRRYINPLECIECGACLPVCPASAISTAHSADPEWAADNARFFFDVLAGRKGPAGSPGGASRFGKIGVDTPFTTLAAKASHRVDRSDKS